MKKILVNTIIIITWFFYPYVLIFAQTPASPTNCTSNNNCTDNQVCAFFKKESNTSTVINATGVCVAKCPETNCPEEKPICDLNLGGVCTEDCTSGTYACPTNMMCEESTGICRANLESCSNDEDCKDNFICDTIIPNSNHIYENQKFGYCTPNCTDNNACTFAATKPFRAVDKNICNDYKGGLCAPNCNNKNYSCPSDNYCDTKLGVCIESTVCEKNSDCESTMICNTTAKNNDNQAIVTRGGICEPKCPEQACPTSKPICDLRLGGLCVEDCTKNGYKCPLYDDGKQSLKCATKDGEDKGLCLVEAKTCTVDTDCDVTKEVCDYVSITKEHKFKTNPTGTCVTKCNENNICEYTNNTPFRSPEKTKCNADLGGLCQPDCASGTYQCTNCTKCNKQTGLCYNFTDDLIIIQLIKGTNVLDSDLNTQESSIRSLLMTSEKLTKKLKDNIIVTSSSVSKFLPAPESTDIDENNITIFIIKQSDVDDNDLQKVESIMKFRPATILTNGGRVFLKEPIKL